MRLCGLIFSLVIWMHPVWADAIVVPSGKSVAFHEMIWNQPGSGLTYRFRFISPEITSAGDDLNYEILERDMAHLCQVFALPRLAATGPKPGLIVISIANMESEFGQAAPEITQYFEAYSVKENQCIWEPL